jgi:hypothetical protein
MTTPATTTNPHAAALIARHPHLPAVFARFALVFQPDANPQDVARQMFAMLETDLGNELERRLIADQRMNALELAGYAFARLNDRARRGIEAPAPSGPLCPPCPECGATMEWTSVGRERLDEHDANSPARWRWGWVCREVGAHEMRAPVVVALKVSGNA